PDVAGLARLGAGAWPGPGWWRCRAAEGHARALAVLPYAHRHARDGADQGRCRNRRAVRRASGRAGTATAGCAITRPIVAGLCGGTGTDRAVMPARAQPGNPGIDQRTQHLSGSAAPAAGRVAGALSTT